MSSSSSPVERLLDAIFGNDVCPHQDALNKVSTVLAILIARAEGKPITVTWDEIQSVMGKGIALQADIPSGLLTVLMVDKPHEHAEVPQPTHAAPSTKQ